MSAVDRAEAAADELAAAVPVDARRVLRRGVIVLIGTLGVVLLGMLALSATTLGREALLDVWARARPGWLLVSIAVISLSQLAVAMRWRALLPPEARGVSPVLLIGVLCAGTVFNYALPGPVGELTAAAMLRRRAGVPVADGLAALAVSRVIGLGSACGAAGALYLLFPLGVPDAHRTLLQAASVGLLLAAVALAAVALVPGLPRAVLTGPIAPLARRSGAVGRVAARVQAVGLQLLDAVASTLRRGPRAWAEALGWALAGHLSVAIGLTVAAHALGADAPFAGVMFTYAAATAGALALFLFPGSHVGWDLSFGAILVVSTGLSPTDAAAVTVVARVQQSTIVLLGVLSLWWLARDLLPEPSSPAEAA